MITINGVIFLLVILLLLVAVALRVFTLIQYTRYAKSLATELFLIYFEDPEAFEEKFEKMPENLMWLSEKWYKKSRRVNNLEDFLRMLIKLADIKKAAAQEFKELSLTRNHPSYFIKVLDEIIS